MISCLVKEMKAKQVHIQSEELLGPWMWHKAWRNISLAPLQNYIFSLNAIIAKPAYTPSKLGVLRTAFNYSIQVSKNVLRVTLRYFF